MLKLESYKTRCLTFFGPPCSLVDQCGVNLYSALTFPQVDRSGKLGYQEFKKLWNDLRLWKVSLCRFSVKYLHYIFQSKSPSFIFPCSGIFFYHFIANLLSYCVCVSFVDRQRSRTKIRTTAETSTVMN